MENQYLAARSVVEARTSVAPGIAALAAQRGGPALATALGEILGRLAATTDPVTWQELALEFWRSQRGKPRQVAFGSFCRPGFHLFTCLLLSPLSERVIVVAVTVSDEQALTVLAAPAAPGLAEHLDVPLMVGGKGIVLNLAHSIVVGSCP